MLNFLNMVLGWFKPTQPLAAKYPRQVYEAWDRDRLAANREKYRVRVRKQKMGYVPPTAAPSCHCNGVGGCFFCDEE